MLHMVWLSQASMEPEPESATSPTSPYPRLLSCAAEHVPSKSGGKAGKWGIDVYTVFPSVWYTIQWYIIRLYCRTFVDVIQEMWYRPEIYWSSQQAFSNGVNDPPSPDACRCLMLIPWRTWAAIVIVPLLIAWRSLRILNVSRLGALSSKMIMLFGITPSFTTIGPRSKTSCWHSGLFYWHAASRQIRGPSKNL